MSSLKPARMRDGSAYTGNQQYVGSGITKSCGRCLVHKNPTGGRKHARYGWTCAGCLEVLAKPKTQPATT